MPFPVVLYFVALNVTFLVSHQQDDDGHGVIVSPMDRLDAMLTMGLSLSCWSAHRPYSVMGSMVHDDGVRCDWGDGDASISFRLHPYRFEAMVCDMLHPEPYPIPQKKSYKLWPFLENFLQNFPIFTDENFYTYHNFNSDSMRIVVPPSLSLSLSFWPAFFPLDLYFLFRLIVFAIRYTLIHTLTLCFSFIWCRFFGLFCFQL